jgi:hypothetical protein
MPGQVLSPCLHGSIHLRLEGGGLELQEIEGLSNLFDEDHPLSNPLAHVETKHRQTVFQKTRRPFHPPRLCAISFLTFFYSFIVSMAK